MRLIDADDLHTHKFLTPQVKVIGGRHNGKTREQIVEAYQKGWNDCIDAIVDNAPTVRPSLIVKDMTKEDIKNFAVIYQRATSKGVILEPERPRAAWEYEPPYDYARRFGKWQFLSGGNYKCTNCNNYALHKSNYCPECGAQMDKGGEV